MTKREKFEVIGSVFAGLEREDKVEIMEFVESEIAALDRKNERAKVTSAKKRAEGDALKDTLEGMLNEEPITVNDILDTLGDNTLTPSKIVARMTQLVKAEKAEKVTVKVDGRKLVGYIKA